MRVGLIDVDSHNFPNLCLMKLSEYHTRRGDRVEWWNPAKQYDLVYKSRVFTDTYSKDTIQVNNADKVIQGGTGYGPGENLPHEIEHERPTAPRITRHLQRWVNNKRIFHSVSDFKDYAPMKKEV